MTFYYKLNIVIIVIILSAVSLGMSNQHANRSVLANSKIDNKSFSRIFRYIKKTIPKELRKCPIVVTHIKILKAGNDSAEDWTVDICQETRIYFVYTYWLKGFYNLVVKSKEEQFAKEKEYWEGDKETWRESLFYVDEIEAAAEENGRTDQRTENGPGH